MMHDEGRCVQCLSTVYDPRNDRSDSDINCTRIAGGRVMAVSTPGAVCSRSCCGAGKQRKLWRGRCFLPGVLVELE